MTDNTNDENKDTNEDQGGEEFDLIGFLQSMKPPSTEEVLTVDEKINSMPDLPVPEDSIAHFINEMIGGDADKMVNQHGEGVRQQMLNMARHLSQIMAYCGTLYNKEQFLQDLGIDLDTLPIRGGMDMAGQLVLHQLHAHVSKNDLINMLMNLASMVAATEVNAYGAVGYMILYTKLSKKTHETFVQSYGDGIDHTKHEHDWNNGGACIYHAGEGNTCTPVEEDD